MPLALAKFITILVYLEVCHLRTVFGIASVAPKGEIKARFLALY